MIESLWYKSKGDYFKIIIFDKKDLKEIKSELIDKEAIEKRDILSYEINEDFSGRHRCRDDVSLRKRGKKEHQITNKNKQ